MLQSSGCCLACAKVTVKADINVKRPFILQDIFGASFFQGKIGTKTCNSFEIKKTRDSRINLKYGFLIEEKYFLGRSAYFFKKKAFAAVLSNKKDPTAFWAGTVFT